MPLKIYGTPRSNTIRPLWLAHELGIDYELVEVAPGAAGSRKPEYMRLNPNGRVPCIDDGGVILWESLAINLYLAKKHGGPLAPANLAEEGRMLQWGFWSAIEIEQPATTVLYHGALLPPEERDPAAVKKALETLEGPLRVLEGALKDGGGYLVGRRFTVADLNAICCVFYLRSAPAALDGTPAVRAWYEAGMARPAKRAAFALRGE
jgi:glutathione S-transferase